MKTNNECVICLNNLTNKTKCLPCNHILHISCIEKLTKSNCPSKYKCPICRYSFKHSNENFKEKLEYIAPSSPTSPPNESIFYYEENTEIELPPPINFIYNISSDLVESQSYLPLPLVQAMLFSFPNSTEI